MNDRDALILAAADNHEDAVVRGALADYLEENGEREDARYLRDWCMDESLLVCMSKAKWESGERVFASEHCEPCLFDLWVRLVAMLCEQEVDWGYSHGRNLVMTWGEGIRVRSAIIRLMPMLKKIVDEVYGSESIPGSFLGPKEPVT